VLVGAQFETFAAWLGFAIAARVGEETLVELGFAGFGTELGAHFAGGVVKQQFVVLATLMFFGFDAGQRLVGWQRPGTAKGRGGVAAVVQHADDHRAVDIAFDKVDQHFLANARDELVTPARPGAGHGHAQPAGGFVVQIGTAAGVFVCPLPVELHLDAAQFVGMHFLAFRPHHGGGLYTFRCRLGLGAVGVSRGERNATALGGDGGLEGAAVLSVS
jgi:hypothetical protein